LLLEVFISGERTFTANDVPDNERRQQVNTEDQIDHKPHKPLRIEQTGIEPCMINVQDVHACLSLNSGIHPTTNIVIECQSTYTREVRLRDVEVEYAAAAKTTDQG
jgi:hypothetical protein